MKIAASVIALIVALALIGSTGKDLATDYHERGKRAEIISTLHKLQTSSIESSRHAAYDIEELEENKQHARETSQAIRSIAGSVFLIAGLLVLGIRKKEVAQ
jgi:hypothetical protein